VLSVAKPSEVVLRELLQEKLAQAAKLQAEISALLTLFDEPPTPKQAVPIRSKLDYIRNAVADAGPDGVTIDELESVLSCHYDRYHLRIALWKLVKKGDGIEKVDNRYRWTGKITRKWSRRTL
jgi:hypothetical protein